MFVTPRSSYSIKYLLFVFEYFTLLEYIWIVSVFTNSFKLQNEYYLIIIFVPKSLFVPTLPRKVRNTRSSHFDTVFIFYLNTSILSWSRCISELDPERNKYLSVHSQLLWMLLMFFVWKSCKIIINVSGLALKQTL